MKTLSQRFHQSKGLRKLVPRFGESSLPQFVDRLRPLQEWDRYLHFLYNYLPLPARPAPEDVAYGVPFLIGYVMAGLLVAALARITATAGT
jgi:hypothetical protein